MKYKGKYLANVAIDIDVTVNDRMRPFDEIKNSIEHELTPALEQLLRDEMKEMGSLEVVQLQAKLWKEGEENETD